MAVIATIATLASLLLPILGKAKIKAEQTSCLSNLRQLGSAWEMYHLENSDWLVESDSGSSNCWVRGNMTDASEATNTALIAQGKLYQYTYSPGQNTAVYRCPTDKGVTIGSQTVRSVRSFSMNAFMGWRPAGLGSVPGYQPFFAKHSELMQPSKLFVFLDEDERSINDGSFQVDPKGRIWWDFPAISAYRHGFSFAINFADAHSEIWRFRDPRTRLVDHAGTDQSGNTDLTKLAGAATVPR